MIQGRRGKVTDGGVRVVGLGAEAYSRYRLRGGECYFRGTKAEGAGFCK